jgi:cbb3-type cytochrome oxidase cytochrome c subunit
MKIYRTEGCWYCHTQEVRTTPVDAPYGKPLGVRAYAGLSPVLLGSERVGPDLAHVGSRYGSAADIMDFLSRPSKSQMPSYGYMSDSDLRALAAYLSSLK